MQRHYWEANLSRAECAHQYSLFGEKKGQSILLFKPHTYLMALQTNVEFPQMSLNFKLLIFKIDEEMPV